MNRTRSSLTGLAAVCAGLLLPSPALASDAEVRQAVTDGAARIVQQERKVTTAAKGISAKRRPTTAQLRRFRAAVREEEAVVRSIRTELRGYTTDTAPVGEGRDLMTRGLALVITGIDRTEKALRRLQEGGSVNANTRSLNAASEKILEGNRLIEQGEPLVGAELTSNTPTEAETSS